MALYLIRFGYTADAWAAMIENPEDRRDMLASRLFGFGGELLGFWYAFGENDGYAIVEVPDNVAAAAVAVEVAASGAFRHLDTTVLITADEMVEALNRAHEFAPRRAPGDAHPTSGLNLSGRT